MKVHVDPERCQGHARCWQICPGVFSLDDEGHASVATPDGLPSWTGKTREAADNCPERAITLS